MNLQAARRVVAGEWRETGERNAADAAHGSPKGSVSMQAIPCRLLRRGTNWSIADAAMSSNPTQLVDGSSG